MSKGKYSFNLKKLIALIFLLAVSLSLIVIVRYIFGSNNFLKKEIIYKEFPSKEPLENPFNYVDGVFVNFNEFEKSGVEWTSQSPCAENPSQALNSLDEYISSKKRYTNDYDNVEVSDLKILTKPEYFEINLSNGKGINVLRCDYFVHDELPNSFQLKSIDQIKLGVFKRKVTQESFNKLVWFLLKSDVTEVSAKIYKTEILETESEIIRNDIGIRETGYIPYGGGEILNPTRHEVFFKYIIWKSDGVVFYSKTIGDKISEDK